MPPSDVETVVGWLRYFTPTMCLSAPYQMHYVVADTNFFKCITVRSYVERKKIGM
ncbi:hypothetical protein K492DRAFT_26942 [Lichtheimia hyalospora FSU 10163]|nr:hypothetical protein K492DRAFT_26942 [Lichtheimia hyalospora FSU 10163]